MDAHFSPQARPTGARLAPPGLSAFLSEVLVAAPFCALQGFPRRLAGEQDATHTPQRQTGSLWTKGNRTDWIMWSPKSDHHFSNEQFVAHGGPPRALGFDVQPYDPITQMAMGLLMALALMLAYLC